MDKSNNINISNNLYYKNSNNNLRISVGKNKKSINNLNNYISNNKKDEDDIEMKDEINIKNLYKDEKENINININKNICYNTYTDNNNIGEINSKDRLINEKSRKNINFINMKNNNNFNIEVINDKNQLK